MAANSGTAQRTSTAYSIYLLLRGGHLWGWAVSFFVCALCVSARLIRVKFYSLPQAVRPASPLLQWEEKRMYVTPGGPTARFGHAAAALDFPAGVVYIYGGLVADGWEANALKASEEVWMFDSRGQV